MSRLLKAWFILVVIGAMMGSLFMLEGRADAAQTRSAHVTDAELRLNRLHTTLLEQVARGELPYTSIVNTDVAQQEADATASIDSIGPGPVTKDYAQYLRVESRVWELRLAGHHDEAIYLAALELVPAFLAVQRDLNAARVALDQREVTAEQLREYGSLLILVVGGFFLIIMFRSAERARRHLIASETQETALRESQRRFASLMSESSDLVTVLDRGGRVTFQSESVEQMLGWTVDDVVGHNIREFLDSADADNVFAVLEQAEFSPDSQRSVDFRMRRSDGGTVSVEAVVVGRFDDPDIAGCLLSIRDQSERLVLEEALRHQAFHDPLT